MADNTQILMALRERQGQARADPHRHRRDRGGTRVVGPRKRSGRWGPAASLFSLGRPVRLAALDGFASPRDAIPAICAHVVVPAAAVDDVTLTVAAVDRVVACVAFDLVVALAADHVVVPGAALHDVVTGAAIHVVVAGVAAEVVVATAAVHLVIAGVATL